ncbi:hypothetical protein D4A35_08330 [Paraclostridium bifermentans]|uniref:Uncharacterized protein n=1 Tax=Paraclostridium bifermentans TaxID=1490 RepID=A0A5P3XF30_PARBF|nr:hypothetical protein [Paraclostridium bifermentans]QEZ68939.1 hypothetical protein D4A35_08330 [Paraclostridium bifermentans]
MSKKTTNDVGRIFLEYKKAIINEDIVYCKKIERALSMIDNNKSTCIQLKHLQNEKLTYISDQVGYCRSHTYKILEDGELELLELLSL